MAASTQLEPEPEPEPAAVATATSSRPTIDCSDRERSPVGRAADNCPPLGRSAAEPAGEEPAELTGEARTSGARGGSHLGPGSSEQQVAAGEGRKLAAWSQVLREAIERQAGLSGRGGPEAQQLEQRRRSQKAGSWAGPKDDNDNDYSSESSRAQSSSRSQTARQQPAGSLGLDKAEPRRKQRQRVAGPAPELATAGAQEAATGALQLSRLAAGSGELAGGGAAAGQWRQRQEQRPLADCESAAGQTATSNSAPSARRQQPASRRRSPDGRPADEDNRGGSSSNNNNGANSGATSAPPSSSWASQSQAQQAVGKKRRPQASNKRQRATSGNCEESFTADGGPERLNSVSISPPAAVGAAEGQPRERPAVECITNWQSGDGGGSRSQAPLQSLSQQQQRRRRQQDSRQAETVAERQQVNSSSGNTGPTSDPGGAACRANELGPGTECDNSGSLTQRRSPLRQQQQQQQQSSSASSGPATAAAARAEPEAVQAASGRSGLSGGHSTNCNCGAKCTGGACDGRPKDDTILDKLNNDNDNNNNNHRLERLQQQRLQSDSNNTCSNQDDDCKPDFIKNTQQPNESSSEEATTTTTTVAVKTSNDLTPKQHPGPASNLEEANWSPQGHQTNTSTIDATDSRRTHSRNKQQDQQQVVIQTATSCPKNTAPSSQQTECCLHNKLSRTTNSNAGETTNPSDISKSEGDHSKRSVCNQSSDPSSTTCNSNNNNNSHNNSNKNNNNHDSGDRNISNSKGSTNNISQTIDNCESSTQPLNAIITTSNKSASKKQQQKLRNQSRSEPQQKNYSCDTNINCFNSNENLISTNGRSSNQIISSNNLSSSSPSTSSSSTRQSQPDHHQHNHQHHYLHHHHQQQQQKPQVAQTTELAMDNESKYPNEQASDDLAISKILIHDSSPSLNSKIAMMHPIKEPTPNNIDICNSNDLTPAGEAKVETLSCKDKETNNNLKVYRNEYSHSNSVDKVEHNNDCIVHNKSFEAQPKPQDPNNSTTTMSNINLDLSNNSNESTGMNGSSVDHHPQSTVAAESDNSTQDQSSDNNHQQAEQQQQQQHVPSQQPPANNRSILILREIDPNSSEASVRDIFDSESCPSKPVHCEYALHNSWYVTFKDDEDARLALAYIRKHIVKWNGQPIMARYKPKPAVPSASNQPPPHIVPTMVMQTAAAVASGQINPQVAGATIIDSAAGGAPGGVTADLAVTSANVASAAAVASNAATSVVNGGQQVVMSSMINSSTSQAATAAASPTSGAAPNGGPVLLPYAHQAMHLGGAGANGTSSNGANGMMQSAQHHHSHHHHQHHHHQHHQMSGTPHHYGYSAVAYYNPNGPMLTPWHYSNGPQYDLSEVFIYNGLAPYPASKASNSKLGASSGTISGAALLGGEVLYQQQAHHHHHLSSHHDNNHHHHHHHHHHQSSQHHNAHHNSHSHHQNNSNNGGTPNQQMFGGGGSQNHGGGGKSSAHQRSNHKNNKHK